MVFTELTGRFQSIKRHPELVENTKEGKDLAKKISHRGMLDATMGIGTALAASPTISEHLSTAVHLSENLRHAPALALGAIALCFIGAGVKRAGQLGELAWMAKNPEKAKKQAEKEKEKAEKKAERRRAKGVKEKTSDYTAHGNDRVYVDGYNWYPYPWYYYGNWDVDDHGHQGGSGGDSEHIAQPIQEGLSTAGEGVHHVVGNVETFGAGLLVGEEHVTEGVNSAAEGAAGVVSEVTKHLGDGAGQVLGEVAKAASHDGGALAEGGAHVAGEVFKGLGKLAGEALSHMDWGAVGEFFAKIFEEIFKAL